MTTQALAITPTKIQAPGGAYVSDPAKATLVMGGSDFDGSPQCPGATIVVHALGDRTNSQLIFTEVTFPPRPTPMVPHPPRRRRRLLRPGRPTHTHRHLRNR